MTTPKTHAIVRLAYLLLGILLIPAGLSIVVCAGTGAIVDTTVSAVDLEHLAQQITDPEQRDQLLKIL
jgi:uncharacterized membrane protein YczE